EDQMRPVFNQRPVFETAGFVLARIAHDIARLIWRLARDAPFPANRKTGAASAAQAGRGDFVEDGFRGKILSKRFVAAGRIILVKRLALGWLTFRKKNHIHFQMWAPALKRVNELQAEAYSPPCITARRGGCAIKKDFAKRPLIARPGWFSD